MCIEGATQVDTLAYGAFDVLSVAFFCWNETFVVRTAHVSREAGLMYEFFATEEACLGPVLVHFFMPGKFFLRMEDVSACCADEIFLSALEVQMASIPVLNEIGVSFECLVA